MLLDNKTGNTYKVHEKITELQADGTFHTVTGYFSVAGLTFLDKQLNNSISEFQFILGELTSVENERNRPLDLLNENISMENALNLTPQIQRLMKFFQMKGFDVILLCPKKLQHNWQQYKSRMGSKFDEDNLIYTIRFHTDLQDKRLENYDDHYTIKGYFQSDRPKLIVIDESHNLRNDKSSRYQLLLKEIIQKNQKVKTLLLSATPINNSLLDIRNQFNLIAKGNPLSAYQPAFYIKQAIDVKVTEDEQQRDRFLVKMMYMLVAKRLESSWISMQKTVNVLLNKHKNVLDKIQSYEKNKKNESIQVKEGELDEDFMEMTIDDIELEKETLSLDDFTLKEFRDDLLSELNKDKDKYENIPNAVYTGFHRQKELTTPEGIVALVGYPNKDVKVKNWRYKDLRVIYIDHTGTEVLKNERETLRFLKLHKAQKRFVPEAIDKGNNPEVAKKLGTALKNWLKSQYISETKTESGETVQTAGKSTLDLLKNLKADNKEALTRIKEGVSEEEKFQLEKFDLITWFIVSK